MDSHYPNPDQLQCRQARQVLLVVGVTFGLILVPSTTAAQDTTPSDTAQGGAWTAVDRALAREGARQPGGVMKYSFPRTDLRITVDELQLKPALALGSWIAFAGPPERATMMGDLVLTQDEVGPVMLALQESGIEQTALHNHILRESPRVTYMHVAGRGAAVDLAMGVRAALRQTRTPEQAAPASPAGALALDTATVAKILGVSGKVNGGVYQVSVPRRETIREGGQEVPSPMGVATAINFQPTRDARAVTTGDFVLVAGEVNPVIQALLRHGIDVTAIHSHLLNEEPRLFFMHFWGNDDAVKLARGLRAALDRTATKTSRP